MHYDPKQKTKSQKPERKVSSSRQEQSIKDEANVLTGENASLRLFAMCAPGLELVTHSELLRLGAGDARPVEGGVEFRGTWEDVYRANLWLRTAGRVLLRLESFVAPTFPELHRKVRRLPWEVFLRRGATVDVHATAHASRLYIKKKIESVVLEGISDQRGFPVTQSPDGLFILVRFAHDVCEISVDTSGELLHRRGYRQETGVAPLRETLAAGLLLLAGYDPTQPFMDPMCGSGTIACEAALIATNRAPGRHRDFAFMNFSTFQPEIWRRFRRLTDELVRTRGLPPIFASDNRSSSVAAAAGNIERAGLSNIVKITQADIGEAEPPPEPGLVLFNPPYGLRIGEKAQLLSLYKRAGGVLRRHFAGWNFGVLVGNTELYRRMSLRSEASHMLVNGGKKVRLFTGRIE